MVEESPAPSPGRADAVRAHPWLFATCVFLTALGMLAGALYLPSEWALARRLAAGAIGGAGSWLLVAFVRFFYD